LELDPAGYSPAQAEFPSPGRIAAVSHTYGNLRGLLNAYGIIDHDRTWTFGTGHLVVVGDVFDRGPQAIEAFWWLRSLAQQDWIA
jgi:hypothetical protein